ncbi:MAG: hypothetical protein AAB383_02400 [Patescibacteria group bacterium]
MSFYSDFELGPDLSDDAELLESVREIDRRLEGLEIPKEFAGQRPIFMQMPSAYGELGKLFNVPFSRLMAQFNERMREASMPIGMYDYSLERRLPSVPQGWHWDGNRPRGHAFVYFDDSAIFEMIRGNIPANRQ